MAHNDYRAHRVAETHMVEEVDNEAGKHGNVRTMCSVEKGGGGVARMELNLGSQG